MAEVKYQADSSKIVITGITEKPIKIPSQMYPLTGNLNYISHENTEDFPDNPTTEKIKEIYNSITPGVGTCYSNIEKLVDALEKEGIKVQPMVGWVFLGGSLPVHHCFAVIENHILDFNPNFDSLYTEENANLGIDVLRDKLTDAMIELRKKPNSETTAFGKASKMALYIASPCKPQAGLKVYQKLMKAFPKHPCYRNIFEGTNETQRMFFKKQGMI
ncbi:MAG: hypothetical protein IKK18_05995 [Clostridia bacterium]|nr:hypothetical protein [Clostridia bacterium]